MTKRLFGIWLQSADPNMLFGGDWGPNAHYDLDWQG